MFCKITFFKFRSTENKNFLENLHKEVDIALPDILFCSAYFPCSGAYICWWVFSKNSHTRILLFLKKCCFCKKFLAQLSYKQYFHNTFKVVNKFP